jgi:hypothetical protein
MRCLIPISGFVEKVSWIKGAGPGSASRMTHLCVVRAGDVPALIAAFAKPAEQAHERLLLAICRPAAYHMLTRHLQRSQMLSTRSEQISAILAAHQALTPDARLEIDVQLADRSSQKANAFFTTSDVYTNGQVNSPS